MKLMSQKVYRSYFVKNLSALLILLIGGSSFSYGQTASRPDRGIRPVGSYAVSDIESINTTNGNVSLSIPLADLPPIAGGRLSHVLKAQYNSKLWDRYGREYQATPPATNWSENELQLSDVGGWQVGRLHQIELREISQEHGFIPPADSSNPDFGYTNFKWKIVLTTPDGAKHELRPTDKNIYIPSPSPATYRLGYYKDIPAVGSINQPIRYYSFDGSYIYVIIQPLSFLPNTGGTIFPNWSVYMPDGMIIENANGIQRIKDTKGNKIKIWTDTVGVVSTTHYQDEQTSREIKVSYNPDYLESYIQYKAVGGANWETITLVWGTTFLTGLVYETENPCITHRKIPDTNLNILRTVVLPPTQSGAGGGRTYSFLYNSDVLDTVSVAYRTSCSSSYQYVTTASHGWGALKYVKVPNGAESRYEYTMDGQNQLPVSDAANIPGESITKKKLAYDGIEEIWNYGIGLATSTVSAPDGSVTTQNYFTSHPGISVTAGGLSPFAGHVYRINYSGKRIIERHWSQLIFSNADQSGPGGGITTYNAVVDAEYTTLLANDGVTPLKMSAKTFQYDFNGNLKQTKDYDWFSPSLVSRDAVGVPTGVPGSGTALLRTTSTTFYNPADNAGDSTVYAKRALATATPLILNAQRDVIVGTSQTQFCYDDAVFGIPPVAGKLTKESRWDNSVTNGVWRHTTHTYDLKGNITSTTDPTGDTTQFFYEDGTYANVTRKVVDPNPSVSGDELTTTYSYDFHTAALLSETDPNLRTTETSYFNHLLNAPDPFRRPGLVTGPPVNAVVNGTTYANQQHKVKTTYLDNVRQVVVESDLNTSGDFKIKSRTTFDQLGRTISVEKNEDGTANYTIGTITSYVQMGRITKVSNPKRNSADSTDGWTRTTRDVLGRVTEVASFSGVAHPPDSETGCTGNCTGKLLTTYYSNETTVKDQANKERRSVADALGRLTQVIEDPNGTAYVTNYSYNELGNLIRVAQGSQRRWFAHDSLGRLIRARNPEQGTYNFTAAPLSLPSVSVSVDPENNSSWSMAYVYDGGNNLIGKTDARGVTTAYEYDGLDRNTKIDYSDTPLNPDIKRFYDNPTPNTNGKGRFWHDYAGGDFSVGLNVEHRAVDSYDAAGRPLVQRQLFKTNSVWSSTYQTSRTYDVAGNVTSQIYPSNRTVNYTYDAAGRANHFAGNLGDGAPRTYATGIVYNAGAQMTREQFGTASYTLYHHLKYTNRGQLYDTRVGTSSATDTSSGTWNRGALRIYFNSGSVYGNGGADNNGNVWRLDHFVPTSEDASQWVLSVDYFGYDTLNRITGIWEQSYTSSGAVNYSVFTQQYSYPDQFGNRLVNTAVSNVPNVFNKPFSIDSATNRLTVPAGQVGSLEYDNAGNQIRDSYTDNDTSVTGGERTYDAENRMTGARFSNGGWNYYTYNADGRRTRRQLNSGPTWWQIFGIGGELLAEYTASAAPSSPSTEFGYRGGQMLILAKGSDVKWQVGDHLGTPRMEIDKSGRLTDDPSTPSINEGVIRHDYLPFGEEISANTGVRTVTNGYAGSTTRQKFTGKERDGETGLDYFEARYFSSVQGRFTSPDEFTGGPDELFDFADDSSENPTLYADLADPQSFNKYQYCYNNPLSYIDLDGHKGLSEWVKSGLELASIVPGPIGSGASLIRAGVALAEGDYKGAIEHGVGVIPGGKLITKGVKLLDKAADALKTVDRIRDASKEIKTAAAIAPCALCFAEGTKVSIANGQIPIEQLRVGDRVKGTHLDLNKPDGWTAVDSTWRLLKLKMPNPDGSDDVFEIELLRSLEWVRRSGAVVGKQINFGLSELGLSGQAEVVAITRAPKITISSGRVVTMTLTHQSPQLLEVDLGGLKEALKPTASHRLYSEDRHDWVAAGELRVGETIRTSTCPARIEAVRWLEGIHRVYNIEVEVDHAYYVSQLELLTHNTGGCAKGGTYLLKDGKEVVRTGRTKDLARREKEHARDPELGQYKFVVDKRTDVYAAQRGREQIIHDKYKPRLNKVKPIRDNHKRRDEYLEAARDPDSYNN